MEVYYYICKECGFVHQVPAYWVSYNPQNTMEYEHLRADNYEVCENIILSFREE